jgi:hypothetical protein
MNAVRAHSARDELIVRYDPTYHALFELLAKGTIEQERTVGEGAADGLTAPRLRFRLSSET